MIKDISNYNKNKVRMLFRFLKNMFHGEPSLKSERNNTDWLSPPFHFLIPFSDVHGTALLLLSMQISIKYSSFSVKIIPSL